jgi:hypothetical protein
MKQLEYLEKIAKRAEDYAIAYGAEADRLEDAGMSKSKQKRALDRFAATWQRDNPIFDDEEFETLSGVARGELDAMAKLGVGGKGAGLAEGFDVNASKQQYRQIQAAKENVGGAAEVRSNIASQSENLADSIAKSDQTFDEKKELLQEMLDGGLSVPDYIIENFQLRSTGQ